MRKLYFFVLLIFFFITPQFNDLKDLYVINIYGIIIYSLLASSILYLLTISISNNINRINFILFIFILYCGITLLWSTVSDIDKQFNQIIKLIIISLPLMLIKLNKYEINKLLKIYFYGSVLGSFQIILNYYLLANEVFGDKRSFLLGIDGNESSIFICFGVILALNYYLKTKRIIYVVILLVLVLSIILTGSRTGFIALLFSLFLMIISFYKLSLRNFILILVSIFVLNILVNYFNFSTNTDRVLNSFNDISNKNLNGRDLIWEAAFDLIPKKLINGFGMNSFSDEIEKKYARFNAHNSFIKIQFELGILGIVLFLAILWKIVISIIKSKNEFKRIIFVFFIVLLISFMTLSWIYSITTWVLLIFLSNISTYKEENDKNGNQLV